MPFPFAHIVYADKILAGKLNQSKVDKQEFFIGSTLPDIRYLAQLERLSTHPNYQRADEFLKKAEEENDSLKLGLLIHLYTDAKYRDYWFNYFKKDFELCSSYYYPIMFLADQILFDGFDKKDNIKEYFDRILDKELKTYPLTRAIAQKWHNIIKGQLTFKIDKDIFCRQSEQIGFDKKLVKPILQIIEKIKADKKIIKAINNFNEFL